MPFAFADTLVLFLAASLSKPIQPLLDDFSARTGVVIERESGASLEHVRKITELHRVPDVVWLADADVFPRMLVPKYATWYAEVARNRMVVAYTSKSKHANEIDASNWTRVLQRADVEVGRTDPNLAPVGYRTLIMLQLAERHYRVPGLATSLLGRAPPRNMRANAAELAALLATGELDYIYDYQSVAESNGFRFIQLPAAIDLGDPKRAAAYAKASATVRGSKPGSTVTFTGEPILYGLTVPAGAPHPSAASRFLAFLTSSATVAKLRAAHVDMLEHPIVAGTGVPVELRGATRR
ncbi:MAG TPA: extracellular solute-binding protein [Gemmatimonadaceae bacterium]|nr:extracellular solute-binding protein [Gemmatimonadaceae bacterium]